MKTFHDNHDRSWSIAINVDAIKRVRSLLGVDLLQVVEGQLLERLVGDPVLLCDVLYCLCQPDADSRQVSDQEFGRAMGGDAIDRATTAVLEELVDFFPQARRQLLRKALDKLETLQARALEVVNQRLESPELDRHLEAELARLGDLSSSWPASSDSTPAA